MRPDGDDYGLEENETDAPEGIRGAFHSFAAWVGHLRHHTRQAMRAHGLIGSSQVEATERPLGEAEQQYELSVGRIISYGGLAAIIIVAVLFGGIYAYSRIASEPTPRKQMKKLQTLQNAMDALRTHDSRELQKLYETPGADVEKTAIMKLVTGYAMAADGASEREVRQRFSGADAQVVLAGLRHWKGEVDKAARALNEALQIRPNDRDLWAAYLRMLLAADRPEKALDKIDEFEERIGPGPTVLLMRGRAQLAAGRLHLAEKQFQQATTYPSAQFLAHAGLSDVLLRTGEAERALRHIDQMLVLQPANSRIQAQKGFVLEKLGRVEGAEKQYRRILKADADNFQALNNLAYLLATEKSRPKEALGLARRALKQRPEHPWVLDTVGWIYHLLGSDEQALNYLQKAHDAAPGTAEITEHLREVKNGVGR